MNDNAIRGITLGVLLGATMWVGIIAAIVFIADTL